MVWSEEQLAVIRAPAKARVLVDAGPGTGKTAVACARVAHLIEECGVDATGIWLVSFTRTAVQELRHRLANSAADPRAVAGVRIATLDAHAWAIQSGFDDDAVIIGTFGDNIERTRLMIGSNDELRKYLQRVQHLLIDEAQDILGVRSTFCLDIISSLAPTVGVTVFGDEAQSIYGFSEDDANGPADAVSQLPYCICNHEPYRTSFTRLELTRVFRTNSPILQQIFADGRAHLRNRGADARTKLTEIRTLINATNDGTFESCHEDLTEIAKEDVNASTFFLFRRRGEVLDASGYLANEDKPHRLRMSGLPVSIQAWIGVLLWDWCADSLTRDQFDALWDERIQHLSTNWNRDHAWSSLLKLAGDHRRYRVDVPKFRRALAGRPPLVVCDADFGLPGPTFGTIHGAKGRESQDVRLYVPPEPAAIVPDVEVEEEARILFVGASRAQTRIYVGPGTHRRVPLTLPTGRATTLVTDFDVRTRRRNRQAKVEVGRDGDIDAECLSGKRYFDSQDAAQAAQHECRDTVGRLKKARGLNTCLGEQTDPLWTYVIRIGDKDGPKLCCLTTQVNKDLFEVARRVHERVPDAKRRPPHTLYHLRTLGARTVVVDDASVRDRLHSPWCDSGFMVAPNLVGYSMCYF
jgi:hypothetical protein